MVLETNKKVPNDASFGNWQQIKLVAPKLVGNQDTKKGMKLNLFSMQLELLQIYFSTLFSSKYINENLLLHQI